METSGKTNASTTETGSSGVAAGAADDCELERLECWENQRYFLFRGWGRHRLPVDRPCWSNKKGNLSIQRESFLLRPGMVWKMNWLVETYGENEENEWYYAPDFTITTRLASPTPTRTSFVRRRKWVRERVKAPISLPAMQQASHDTWRSYLFYGFTEASSEELDAEQQRQHHGFAALSELAKHSMEGDRNSPIPDEFSTESMEVQQPAAHPDPPKPTSAHLMAIYKHGIPNVLREHLWVALSGAAALKCASPHYFAALSNEAALITSGEAFSEIIQDVRRTAPRHPYFEGRGSLGTLRLTNTLLALSLHPEIPPYHQAFSYIVAVFLLNATPGDSFWLMVVVLQQLLFSGYHEHFMLQIDLRIIAEIQREMLSELDTHFAARQIDVAVFASGWLQGLFCAHFPLPAACRIFDVMFAERNSSILPRFVLAFLKIKKQELLSLDSSGAIGELANVFARTAFDITQLLMTAQQDNLTARVLRRRDELLAQHQQAIGKAKQ